MTYTHVGYNTTYEQTNRMYSSPTASPYLPPLPTPEACSDYRAYPGDDVRRLQAYSNLQQKLTF